MDFHVSTSLTIRHKNSTMIPRKLVGISLLAMRMRSTRLWEPRVNPSMGGSPMAMAL
jgi:hypothetical protein